MPTLDLSPLRRRLTRAELADVKRRARAGEFGPSQPGRIAGIVGPILVSLIVVVVAVVGVLVGTSVGQRTTTGRWWLIIWLVCCVVGLYQVMRATAKSVRTQDDWARIASLARANGLQFSRYSPNAGYPGSLFNQGTARAALDHVQSPVGRLADTGTYTYTTGSGENSHSHYGGFAAFRLPQRLPNLWFATPHQSLLAKAAGGDFADDQRITFGDPFDSRFTAYAPHGYGPDAFRLFSPNVLEALLTIPEGWSLEIVDDWAFLYGALNLTDPSTWEALQRFDDVFLDRISRAAVGYVDDRAAAPTPTAYAFAGLGPAQSQVPVAASGRRLRASSPIRSTIVWGSVAIAWMILIMVARQWINGMP